MSFDLPYLPSEYTPDQFQIWWQQMRDAIVAQEQQQDLILAQLVLALSYMPDIADIHVQADYTGTILTGQLPRTVMASRFFKAAGGDTDQTALATWSFSSESGAVTASFPSPGGLEITDLDATDIVTVTSELSGVEISRSFIAYLDISGAPSTGGGETASTTTFNSFNSTTHADVTAEIQVTVGASGDVDLNAPLAVFTDEGAPTGTFNVFGKWLWWNGAAWVDVAAEVASDPDCVVKSTGASRVTNGVLNVSQTKTGLAPAAVEKFKLQARNASGTRVMYLSGEASAVSS